MAASRLRHLDGKTMAEEESEPAEEAPSQAEQVQPGLTEFCADPVRSDVGRSDSGHGGEAANGAANRNVSISPKRSAGGRGQPRRRPDAQRSSANLRIRDSCCLRWNFGHELAKSFRPDVALVDIGLPAMDGYQLARRLRQLPELRATRLFAVTGYGQLADRMRSAQAGFDCHLVKPVDLEELRRLIDTTG